MYHLIFISTCLLFYKNLDSGLTQLFRQGWSILCKLKPGKLLISIYSLLKPNNIWKYQCLFPYVYGNNCKLNIILPQFSAISEVYGIISLFQVFSVVPLSSEFYCEIFPWSLNHCHLHFSFRGLILNFCNLILSKCLHYPIHLSHFYAGSYLYVEVGWYDLAFTEKIYVAKWATGTSKAHIWGQTSHLHKHPEYPFVARSMMGMFWILQQQFW